MERESIRILLVGSGGREHALAWKLSQSPSVKFVKVAPGNGGTAAGLPKVQNVNDLDVNDFSNIIEFARTHRINLIVPGPEVPLVAGIADVVRAAGLRCFGPSKAAAHMEGSKTFAKDFMARNRIPTAQYMNFSAYEKAKEYVEHAPFNVCIKASGLASGKGVIMPSSNEEAITALREIMQDQCFGSAGEEVVIEEFLEGQELSFLSFSDGYTIQTLPPGQDHKQIGDGDTGLNTGGMGVYAPSPVATAALVDEIHQTILQPTVAGMRKEQMPFVGMLFTGVMVTKNGPKVLEYNVRFGDPETQAMLPLMDADLAEVMIACTDGYLDAIPIKAHPLYACTVVASASGYPGPYTRGDEITLDNLPSDTYVFHAGTKTSSTAKVDREASCHVESPSAKTGQSPKSKTDTSSNVLTTSGGRVIAATSCSKTLQEAISQAYTGIKCIHYRGMYYRSDIGKKGLEAQRDQTTKVNGNRLTYASAGVDIDAGNTLVKRIKPLVASTARPGASAELGGFGGVFDLANAGYTSPPSIVVGTDGVGTKLKIAQAIGKHDTIGIDLVAMNVNDLITQGAEPLLFLDTYSCGRLDPEVAVEVIKGICAGCREAGCALVGGETAEMGGLFLDEDTYDVVGSAMGAIARDKIILPAKSSINNGDLVLGMASNGCHSNGFSLIRKIIENVGLQYHEIAPWAAMDTVGKSLLTPTRIYVKPVLKIVHKELIKGMAHITGGGLLENVPRILPNDLAAELDVKAWEVPKVMQWLKKHGNISDEEFAHVFNTGLGMIMVVDPAKVDEALTELREAGETVEIVGRIIKREGTDGCVLKNMARWHCIH